ncbi:MAG: hypothetical protein CMG46_01780 [Candidatus Marinimicrobia bacterium]|nr:hypothetical protein [Candidatus Neomarinimicrobiota bacterium]
MLIMRNFKPLNVNLSYSKGALLQKPYLHFSLSKLNIDKPCESFKYSYNNLEIDQYLEDNVPPKRLRAYALYNIEVFDSETISLRYNSDNYYKQNVTDDRGKLRIFKPIEYKYIYSDYIVSVITQTMNLLLQCNPYIKCVNIGVHQVRNITYPDINSTNSPEGIHRDGSDYIISALVVNKQNISGANSIIKDYNQVDEYITSLETNEGIFQEDKELWHYVTDMYCTNDNYLGYRDIIGLDIDILQHINECNE